MKKILAFVITLLSILGIYAAAHAAQQPSYTPSLLPITTNTYYLGSTSPDRVWNGLYSKALTISGTGTSTFAGSISVTGGVKAGYLEAPIFSSGTCSGGGFLVDTNTLVVDCTNHRVGVGIAAPGYPLHVNKDNVAFRLSAVTGTEYVGSSFGNAQSDLIIAQNGGTPSAVFTGSLAYAALFGNDAAKAIQFATNNAVNVTIASGGNMGIGISAPDWPLHVAHTGSASAIDTVFRLENTTTAAANGAGVGTDYVLKDDGGTRILAAQVNAVFSNYTAANRIVDLQFLTRPSAVSLPTEKMRITGGGNVGIGTSTPSAKLEVAADKTYGSNGDDGQFQMDGTTNPNKGIVIGYDTTTNFAWIYSRIKNSQASPLILNGQGDGGNGKVGIGLTNPAYILDVKGSGSVNLFNVQDSSGNSKLNVLTGGNVGVGTSTPGTLLSIGNTSGINITTGTSTSHATGGFDLTDGCWSIRGVCQTGGGGAAASTGTTIDYITATSSNNQGATAYAAATTTTVTSGHRLNIRAACAAQNFNGNLALEVRNSGGGGTSTIDWTSFRDSTTQYVRAYMEGNYTPTASGNLFIAIDQDVGGVVFGGASGTYCRDILFSVTQYSN